MKMADGCRSVELIQSSGHEKTGAFVNMKLKFIIIKAIMGLLVFVYCSNT